MMEQIIEKLRALYPDEDDPTMIEELAQEYVEEFGVHDALLFLEWVERKKQVDYDQRPELALEIMSRARGNRLKDVLKGLFEDTIHV